MNIVSTSDFSNGKYLVQWIFSNIPLCRDFILRLWKISKIKWTIVTNTVDKKHRYYKNTPAKNTVRKKFCWWKILLNANVWVSGHFTPGNFTPGNFTPGHFTPGYFTPGHFTLRHFTPRIIHPRTFHPTDISLHEHFTPRTFHPTDISPRFESSFN